MLKLYEALKACSNLRVFLLMVFVQLAFSLWPTFVLYYSTGLTIFKKPVSVIISKPGKLAYNTFKIF